ncbi:macro domain-like protein [Lentithecium fluviatile CBS 122367]|uniref:Macro domain-like protein n=1 Tax=Lentithecium fluviatile CBS 122367 TaxID=1168545 RepID=A0A6G1J054_9PLEO|nr:macro domain-like protein [Lentithecium fluviatile CBS 122367]
MAAPESSTIPSFHLLCMEEENISAFSLATQTLNLPPSIPITIHHSRLADLDPSITFDAIVSPANSYARLDGGFDDALSRVFAPKEDYHALTRVAQAAVYREYRGFLPPGGCLLIDLEGEGGDVLKKSGTWGCRYLALCPTMKVPQDVTWDREVVYECVWSLLAAVDRHNRAVRERASSAEGTAVEREIKSVLMTPLATGCGAWSAKQWAEQTVLAIEHFVEAVEKEKEGVWIGMGHYQIARLASQVENTYEAAPTGFADSVMEMIGVRKA